MNGRSTDPKTAPCVPVYVHIEHRREEVASSEPLPPDRRRYESSVTIVVQAWLRATDEILEYTFQDPVQSEIRKRPLSHEDALWLKNIGARQ